MKINKLRMLASDKGFTLIELMIVIAIIGILAAIAIPNFITYRNKAFCTSTEKDGASLQGALANYFSIASNTSFTFATASNVVTFGAGANAEKVQMSGLNKGQVVPITGGFRISVQDGSARCPNSYTKPNPNWGPTAVLSNATTGGPWYSIQMK